MCVMPSELELFLYSILEPMAAKVPIISVRLSCVEELLDVDQDCLMYSPQDVEHLADRVLTMASSEAYRSQLASNAYSKLINQLDWAKVSDL